MSEGNGRLTSAKERAYHFPLLAKPLTLQVTQHDSANHLLVFNKGVKLVYTPSD